MTAEGALVSLLSADAGVTAIVADRIHPMTDPQDLVLPKITFQRISTARSAEAGAITNDGPTGLAVAHFQVDCWSADLLGAIRLAAAACRAINGYRGTVSNLVVDCLHITDQRQIEAGAWPGREKPIQRLMLQVVMSYDSSTEN